MGGRFNKASRVDEHGDNRLRSEEDGEVFAVEEGGGRRKGRVEES